MKILFAGTEPGRYRRIVEENGGKSFLNSFYSLGCGKKNPEPCGDFYLLDSGGFSARVHGFDIDVTEYAKYLNKYHIKYAFNLDVSDLKKSLDNQHYLERNTNTYIIPVYHCVEWINKEYRDLIDYYAECYPFISLGGVAAKELTGENLKKFLRYVFKRTRNDVMVHGLGITSEKILREFPFFCADSTSWQSMARFGSSSFLSKEMSRVRSRNRPSYENIGGEVRFWVEKEDFYTRLWKSKGVVWEEPDFDTIMKKRKLMTYEEWKEKNGKV